MGFYAKELLVSALSGDILQILHGLGIMGDTKACDYTIGIRAIISIDGMTSDWE